MGQGRWVRAVAGTALALAAVIMWEGSAYAASGAEGPFPRFEALHADKVNLRAGPGSRYPIEWVYLRKGWPVEVIGQFDHWRRVRDFEGTEGWVEEKMISPRRGVIITGGVRALRQSPDLSAALIARAEPGVMARLDECRGDWCRIEAGDTTGWVQRSDLWGVYPNESVP
jgi:SH3-like domain-containing protein